MRSVAFLKDFGKTTELEISKCSNLRELACADKKTTR